MLSTDRLPPAASRRPLPAVRGLLSVVLLLLLLTACTPTGQFASNRPPAADQGAMSRQPAAVTFLELDANPLSYSNRLIRVSGDFLPAPEIGCEPYKGPGIDWALVDAQLRLDVQGFARVVQLIPEGTSVTVDGFWQRYHGPVGCGKEPPTETLWYLRAVQLVQPNPLTQLAVLPEQPVEPQQEAEPTVAPEETGTPTPTPSPSPSPTPTGATPTPDLTASPTPTLEPGDTATPTPTLEPGDTPEPTATPSPTPEAGGDTPPPPDETPTPSGYPEPTATPEPYN